MQREAKLAKGERSNAHVIFQASVEGGAAGDAAGGTAQGWRWTHMRRSPEAEATLIADEEIPEPVAWALLEEDTMPRASQVQGGTLLILRGVNLRPGAEPEDMVSLRLWVTTARVVSTEVRRLAQTDELIAAFEAGAAPESPDAFVLTLVERLRAAAEPVLDDIEERLSAMETLVAVPGRRSAAAQRAPLAALRHDVILLHRHLAPQALALDALVRSGPAWLTEPGALREEAEAFRRITADLDALRQRAQLVAEEISLAATERTNQIMLTLSLVAAVFLPLAFLTGLFGVNLDGIPFAGQPWAFAVFCALLLGIGALALWLAMRLLR